MYRRFVVRDMSTPNANEAHQESSSARIDVRQSVCDEVDVVHSSDGFCISTQLPLQTLPDPTAAAAGVGAADAEQAEQDLREKRRRERRARIAANQRELALLQALPSDQVESYLL